MTRERFDRERAVMLAQLRDWIALGADLAEVEQEIQATARAMRDLARLRMMEQR
jgi:hypothetical protein